MVIVKKRMVTELSQLVNMQLVVMRLIAMMLKNMSLGKSKKRLSLKNNLSLKKYYNPWTFLSLELG